MPGLKLAMRNSNPTVNIEELKINHEEMVTLRPVTAELKDETVMPKSFHVSNENESCPRAHRELQESNTPLDMLNDS